MLTDKEIEKVAIEIFIDESISFNRTLFKRLFYHPHYYDYYINKAKIFLGYK